MNMTYTISSNSITFILSLTNYKPYKYKLPTNFDCSIFDFNPKHLYKYLDKLTAHILTNMQKKFKLHFSEHDLVFYQLTINCAKDDFAKQFIDKIVAASGL